MARRNQDDAPQIGHNSALNSDEKRKLKGYIDQIVGLEREKIETQSDIKGLYESVKDANFSVKAVRRIVKMKLQTQEQKKTETALQEITETYMHALGMLADTPLGKAAIENAQTDLEDAIEGAANTADTSTQPFRDDDPVMAEHAS